MTSSRRSWANIYEKIGISSRNDAVRKAIVEQRIGIHEITRAADGTGSSDGPRD